MNDNYYKKDTNITIHLLYKRKKLLCKFNITNRTSEEFKKMLKNDIFEHEVNVLGSKE